MLSPSVITYLSRKIRVFALWHSYFNQASLKQALEIKGVHLSHKVKTYIFEIVTYPILKTSVYCHMCTLCLIVKVLNSNMCVYNA